MTYSKELLRKLAPLCELTLYSSDLDTNLLKKVVFEATKVDELAPVVISTYPQFVPAVKHAISKDAKTLISTVVAWPKGDGCEEAIRAEIYNAVEYYKVHEVEYVIDYSYNLLLDQMEKVIDEISRVKSLVGTQTILKVVLEIEEVRELPKIASLVRCAILGGADFIVTCTGKSGHCLSPEKLQSVLTEIAHAINGETPCDKEVAAGTDEELLKELHIYCEECFNSGSLVLPNRLRHLQTRHVGLKLQGGVSSIETAMGFIRQVERSLGDEFTSSSVTFRIGSSTLHPLIIDEVMGLDNELRIVHTLGIKQSTYGEVEDTIQDELYSSRNESSKVPSPQIEESEEVGEDNLRNISQKNISNLNSETKTSLNSEGSKAIPIEYMLN
ncbi:deoxyribose-phosphate aldolase family protein [Cryptosporidium muris RN66]|uniref:Deoxyribose-phosphate aldolase family protein n=1 Tax=Cryptosporidium muris (strain RN66) TaxID=441375 RepID=B6AFZ9_CRYMR|nr:deoxyribose-phosphate aldolase family protein [Cryptosporidium muris RN66]EEA07140.1 deoxyribose-phosphate aldolase family protein [Cryptosporidium muris RN66]|eukprot:XP_002141489.1 deoxyribose-phosphate aldolase family protein [Cryptosporidium muris RN66]